MIHTDKNLALDKEVLLIENRQLQQTFNQEKRYHKYSRAMKLLDFSNLSLIQFFLLIKMQSIYKNITASEAVKKNKQTCKKNVKLQYTILKKQKKTDIMKQRMK